MDPPINKQLSNSSAALHSPERGETSHSGVHFKTLHMLSDAAVHGESSVQQCQEIYWRVFCSSVSPLVFLVLCQHHVVCICVFIHLSVCMCVCVCVCRSMTPQCLLCPNEQLPPATRDRTEVPQTAGASLDSLMRRPKPKHPRWVPSYTHTHTHAHTHTHTHTHLYTHCSLFLMLFFQIKRHFSAENTQI